MKNPNILCIDSFRGYKKPIRCRCECGNDNWYPTPNNLLRGSKCSQCVSARLGVKRRKKQETFINECAVKNPWVEIVGEYKGANEPIEVKCVNCGNMWCTTAKTILRGQGCARCQKRNQTSFPEQAFYFYIKKKFPDSKNSYREGMGRMELDIYIPKLKIAIEYDGRNWHKDKVEKEQKKYELCKSRGITLIRVKEMVVDDYEDKICDRIIISKYGDTKRYKDLDSCIQELLSIIGVEDDIDTSRDRMLIQQQYFNIVQGKSLGELNPDLIEEWYQSLNENITPFMVYANSNTLYYWKCRNCGYVYQAPPSNRMKGHGCARCSNVIRYSHDEFVALVKEKNPMIRVIGKYINMDSEVECECIVCSYKWSSRASVILRGVGCKKCINNRISKERTKSEEIFIEQVKNKNPHITVIGKYKNNKIRIECKCNLCNRVFFPIAQSLVSSSCCDCRAPNRVRMVKCVETGIVYNSISEAEKHTQISHSLISRNCNGKSKSAGGYHWKFISI